MPGGWSRDICPKGPEYTAVLRPAFLKAEREHQQEPPAAAASFCSVGPLLLPELLFVHPGSWSQGWDTAGRDTVIFSVKLGNSKKNECISLAHSLGCKAQSFPQTLQGAGDLQKGYKPLIELGLVGF